MNTTGFCSIVWNPNWIPQDFNGFQTIPIEYPRISWMQKNALKSQSNTPLLKSTAGAFNSLCLHQAPCQTEITKISRPIEEKWWESKNKQTDRGKMMGNQTDKKYQP